MKEKIKTLWNIINSKIFSYIILGIIVFFALHIFIDKNNIISEKTKLEQNLIAANDTLKIYKNKYNETVAEKSIYILSIKELKKQNSDLYNEIKKQKGDIISLNTAIISLKQDTTILNQKLKKIIGEAIQVDSNTWNLPWKLSYNWDKDNFDIFEGYTTVSLNNSNPINIIHDNTNLTKRTSNIKLVFGEKVVDNKYKVYVTSNYPGLSTESLEGVFIDPNTNNDIKKLIKKNHWFNGFSFGISATIGRDLFNNNFGLMVGPSVTWNIYNW
jgi:FtsZ-binding cell division protein ZapB